MQGVSPGGVRWQSAQRIRFGQGGPKNTTTQNTKIKGLTLYPLAVAVGAFTGVLAAAFHFSLEKAFALHAAVGSMLPGLGPRAALVSAFLGAAMAAGAVGVVHRFAPEAAGSGIQEIEGAMQCLRAVRWARVAIVKFVGGVLAMGAGLLLGREGPTVHMGGCVGRMIGEKTGADAHGMNTLLAAGAGAGLSAAFSAPVAGVIFVTEEMRRRFDYNFVSLHAVIAACIIAKVVNDQVFGMQPALPIQLALDLPALPPVEELLFFVPLYLLLGAMLGICGAAFNTALLGMLRLVDRWRRPTKLILVAAFGAGVGTLLAVAPEFVGGGEALIEGIFPHSPAIPMLLLLLAVRAVLTFASYATGTPGGIFAPMLALGTLIGMGFAAGVQALFPHSTIHPGAFGIAAMGGLFAATVRAPLTGIVLVAELTGSFGLLSAMVLTCLTASITAQSLGSKPLYDLLLARTLCHTVGSGPPDDEQLEETIR